MFTPDHVGPARWLLVFRIVSSLEGVLPSAYCLFFAAILFFGALSANALWFLVRTPVALQLELKGLACFGSHGASSERQWYSGQGAMRNRDWC